MQHREQSEATNWPSQMPQLSSIQSSTPNRMHQNSTDQLDDAESLLLNSDNFDDIENLLGDEDMMGTLEDCLREQDFDNSVAPVLEAANIGNAAVNGLLPTTSSFNSLPMLSNQPNGLLAPKLSRTGTRPSFDETNTKITNFMAKIPFRSNLFAKNEQRQVELVDYSYNPEMDMSFNLRKFDYFQLLNRHAKLSSKIKALATLLKYELEEDHDYFLLRNADIVLQICVDHKCIFTNCMISWYGSHLRPNERLKTLFQQNKWLSIMRHLKLMGTLVPSCVPMNDRINCLNGLIILEHDLALLFKETPLTTCIYGKSTVEVYRQRTDVTPFTIAIQWETLKKNLLVSEAPQFDLMKHDALYVYLSVTYNEYTTLFPTTSCLSSNMEWAEMTTGINTPGKYCFNFSQPMIVRRAMMAELLEFDASVYTIRPVNWLSELALGKISGQSLVFRRREDNSECHRYIFSNWMLNEFDVYLVKRITFNSPKTIIGLLTLLRKQACFIGLMKNLFERFERRKTLPYTEHLVAEMQSDDPTSLVLQFNKDKQVNGTVSVITKNSGFELTVSTTNGQNIDDEKIQEWNNFLNRTWSIPALMHRISIFLKKPSKEVRTITKNGSFNNANAIANNGPQFKKFEYLQDRFIMKQSNRQSNNKIRPTTAENSLKQGDQKEQLKKRLKLLQSYRNSSFLSEYFSTTQKVYKLKKSTALKQIRLPSACLQAVMSSLSKNSPIRAIISNKKDLSRVPKFAVDTQIPTILPTMEQAVKLEQRRKILKQRKLKNIKSAQNLQSKRQTKKPNILKSSSAKTPLSGTEKNVRLDSVVQMAGSNENRVASVPNPNAQPTKSILNQRRSQKQPNTVDKSSSSAMNRLTLAQKILRRRGNKRPRFFGKLAGWRKLYKHIFRIEPEVIQKHTFKQETNLEFGNLLLAQSENYINPKVHPLPNPLSPDFRRISSQVPSFSVNPVFNSNSFGLHSNHNAHLNTTFQGNNTASNPVFNQPALPLHIMQKQSLENIKEMVDSSFDTNQAQANVTSQQHLMDLNSSDLATRRKERNTNTGHSGLDAEMLMDEDGFEESEDESECDPPPPHKILQQQKLAERRKRDQELRDQRQEKINKMVLEKQKQVQQQQEEFAQRHQLSLRATRTTSNAGLTPGTSFNVDQSANMGIKIEDRYNEYDIGNEQKPVIESLSIKLPRAVAESIGRKTSHSHETEKEIRRSRKKLQRTSSISSTGTNQSGSLSGVSEKSHQKKSKRAKKETGSDRKSKKSNLANKTVESNTRSSRSKDKEAARKISRGKENPQRSVSSSSASSSSSGSSNSSDSRPPTLTGRLQRQSSALTDILQQDDESRQSTRSTSSIPHLLAANEPTQNWQSKETGKNSRKTSTISASTLSGYYPFELESGTKNEFDDPESPPFAQFLASTSAKRYEDIAKQKTNDAEKSRSKSSKDRSRQKHKSGDTQSGTESDKQKDEKLKDKKPKPLENMKSSKSMSIDKIAERLKAKETTVLKLKIEKDEKSKVVQKEGDKLKVKDKSTVPKNKPSPRLQPLPGVFDVPTTDSKVFKRKRDGKEAVPPTKRPPTKEAASKPKDSREVSKDNKLPILKPETSTVSKSKRPKEIKLLQEIPASPLPPVQTRKRSPLPRRKEEAAKKTRLADPEFKPSSSIDKSLRSSKNAKPEEARSVVKRTLSTTSDEKRRKVRKLEKEPETPNKKKPANIFPDLPEFTGRPSLNNLKNFKIPKVVDADTTKTNEKDKEEVEKEKEPVLNQEREPQRDRSRESREGGSSKESRAESNRGERWDRDEKRESYSHSAERRESYAEGTYDRRGGADSANFHPSDSNQREHFYPNRGNSAHYSSRGNKFYNSHHSNYPSSSSHRSANSNYESSPVYNERSSFRRQRGNPTKPYDEFLPSGPHSTSKSRSGTHYTQPPHHKKSLTEASDSPSQSSRSSSAQRRYTREKSNPAPWAANYNYPEESSDYPPLIPPPGSSQYSIFNPSNQFQSPTEEQFDGRDRDFRPPYHHVESPDGLQIDE